MVLRPGLSVILASSKIRLVTLSRYPGQLLVDIVTLIVFALIPILIGRATGGIEAGAIFASNTGTENNISYMLIGSCMFSLVFFAFWHVAFWLRSEMETGTIEALYLRPTQRIWVAGGTALYSLIRGIVAVVIAYVLGSFLYGINPFQGQLALALVFILIGAVPLYSMTLIFGALVLRVKQANSLVNLMQWIVSFLMGVFFPITVLPAKGIYVFFEQGETDVCQGVRVPRIVRIGTHKKDGRFTGRIRQHYRRVNSLRGSKNGSVFRKHVGSALLRMADPQDPRLELSLGQKGGSYFEVEEEVSKTLRNNFTFSCIRVDDAADRIYIEKGLIALLARYSPLKPSKNWSGHHAANEKIRDCGLWNVQRTTSTPISASDLVQLRKMIESTISNDLE